MRTRPIVGKKVWFGPRNSGWGWSPVSWEGWLLFVVILAGLFVPVPFMRENDTARIAWSLGLVVFALVVCFLKGTSPGGPAQRAQLKREQEVPEDE